MSKADVKFPSSGGGTPYALDVEDEGSVILSNPSAINFVGAGVSVQENPFPSGTAEVTINGFTFDVQYNDVLIATDPPYLNFKGLGVQASGVPGGGVDVLIFSGLNIDDEGSAIVSNPDTLNFTGAGVTVTESPSGTAEINIPGGTPYALDVEDDGSLILSNPTKLNFNGPGVTVTENPSGVADISIPGGAGIASVFVDKVGVSGTTNGLQTSVKSYSLAANTYSNLELEITIQSAQNSNSAMVNDVTIRLNGSSSGIFPGVFYCETTAVSAVANRLILTRLLKAVFTRTAAATLTIDVNNSNCNWEIQNVTLKGIP